MVVSGYLYAAADSFCGRGVMCWVLSKIQDGPYIWCGCLQEYENILFASTGNQTTITWLIRNLSGHCKEWNIGSKIKVTRNKTLLSNEANEGEYDKKWIVNGRVKRLLYEWAAGEGKEGDIRSINYCGTDSVSGWVNGKSAFHARNLIPSHETVTRNQGITTSAVIDVKIT